MPDSPAFPPVEVNVSDRCEHDCFMVWMGSPSVWHFQQRGGHGFSLDVLDAEVETVLHRCYDACDEVGCWEEEESHAR